MYWDDKYGTPSVSNEVVAEMREMLNKDNQYLATNKNKFVSLSQNFNVNI